METISTKQAPQAIGPYSQGIREGKLIFVSGQIPLEPESGAIPTGIEAQAKQVCENIAAILKASGSDLQHVLKTTCFLADMGDFTVFNEVYETYFVSKPARSCVAVKELTKHVLCEIEVIAAW